MWQIFGVIFGLLKDVKFSTIANCINVEIQGSSGFREQATTDLPTSPSDPMES
jgi:hypothetical protein